MEKSVYGVKIQVLQHKGQQKTPGQTARATPQDAAARMAECFFEDAVRPV
ncbi:MAG TPA: hypothetical protein H9706_02115 [Candidatus Gemmiger stercorigallinarum]|nr:hypothetical protein [Candidatus Gemmiger stercorigallinarum]